MLKNAWIFSFVRTPLLVLVMLFIHGLIALLGYRLKFQFIPELSTTYFTIVNIFCFYFLYHILKKEGRTISELIGFKKERLMSDVLYGFLWLFILFIPYMITINGTMFLLYGSDYFQHFSTVFVGDVEDYQTFESMFFKFFTAFISLFFPFMNAPIEELMYRGYAQPILINKYEKAWLGILIPSLGFAIQHLVLAVTIPGAIVFVTSYLVWGIFSGFIYYKQKRLLPLIICHFIVNLSFSIVPILLLFLEIN